MTVQTLLKQCFRDQPIYYSIEDKFIIIHRKDKETKINPVDIVGTIKNDKGDPVTGASVTVLETLKTTTSDAEGGFALQQVPAFATLIFSGTNVEGSQIVLHGQQSLNVILKAKVSKLDEVQVIAYGTTTKRLNTGDVSTVTAETFAEQPVSNPLSAMEGRIPGLVITQNSGTPGSGFFVQIRGQNSISNGNDPLYIIDGVPYTSTSLTSAFSGGIVSGGNPLSSINPSDIESVNILKDADATSIYGSRGANGVILITTRRGKQGRTKIDLNSYFGVGQVDRKLKLMNTQQYLIMRNEAFKNDGAAPSLANGDYDLLSWDTTRYTDWQKLLIGNTAHIADFQLNISGGNENTQFNLSGGFHRQTNVFPGDFGDQKGSGHFNLNHISQDNKLKVDLSLTYAVENNNQPQTDFVYQAMYLPPDWPAAVVLKPAGERATRFVERDRGIALGIAFLVRERCGLLLEVALDGRNARRHELRGDGFALLLDPDNPEGRPPLALKGFVAFACSCCCPGARENSQDQRPRFHAGFPTR